MVTSLPAPSSSWSAPPGCFSMKLLTSYTCSLLWDTQSTEVTGKVTFIKASVVPYLCYVLFYWISYLAPDGDVHVVSLVQFAQLLPRKLADPWIALHGARRLPYLVSAAWHPPTVSCNVSGRVSVQEETFFFSEELGPSNPYTFRILACFPYHLILSIHTRRAREKETEILQHDGCSISC